MSCKKVKPAENNENLCPLNRKRVKSISSTSKPTTFSFCKIEKLETGSSPAGLEYLEEMGISVLESEESSSSLASALAVPLTDENSNEATPNLDAAKFCHQRISYRTIDNTLDKTAENLKEASPAIEIIKKSSVSEMCGGEQHHEEPQPQHKKVAYLGVGTNINTTNSNSNSPTSNGRGTRSPLTMVTCNSQSQNASKINQQQTPTVTIQPSSSSIYNNSAVKRMQSPSLPSTSRHAAELKQQQQKSKQTLPADSFFLFRNNPADSAKTKSNGVNYFNVLSDEIILQILRWLPKKALLRCSYVCRRFNQCARDESLWARLDLACRSLRPGALQNVLTRGVVVLRLAQTELNHPVFDENFGENNSNFQARLQYLDLSMASVTNSSLKTLLSFCRQLRKLSLEHVPVDDEICNEIAANTKLEALNLAMCVGLEAWSVRKMLEALPNLHSLNISWTNLSVDAVTSLVTNVTPNLMRLNVAGCRKTMFDSHLSTLAKRCPQLLELDLSDCTGLTGHAILILCKFKMLEYLSLSRCYLIPPSAHMYLKDLTSLTYLDVFGMLSESAMEILEQNLPALGINKFIHSSVARPTVGTRRTSIWGLRTRD